MLSLFQQLKEELPGEEVMHLFCLFSIFLWVFFFFFAFLVALYLFTDSDYVGLL